jgi:hypothetical protein
VARLRVSRTGPASRKPLAQVSCLDRWDGPPLAT